MARDPVADDVANNQAGDENRDGYQKGLVHEFYPYGPSSPPDDHYTKSIPSSQ